MLSSPTPIGSIRPPATRQHAEGRCQRPAWRAPQPSSQTPSPSRSSVSPVLSPGRSTETLPPGTRMARATDFTLEFEDVFRPVCPR